MDRTEGNKTDQIWDLVMKLAEDEDTTGKITYGKAGGTGRLTVTLDGRRMSVILDEQDDDEGPKKVAIVDEGNPAITALMRGVERPVFCLGRLMVDPEEAQDYEPDFCDLYEASEAQPCKGECAYTESVRKALAPESSRLVVGYIEEDALPVTGRATIHQEPNPSRVALYMMEADHD